MSNIQQTHELKALHTQKEKARAELEVLKTEQREHNRKVNELQEKIKGFDAKIKQLSEKAVKKGEIVVSEHAYLRYFTRVLGFDLEQIKKEIVSPASEAAILNFRNGTFPGSGFKIKVKDNTVVTLLTPEEE